MTLTCMYDDQDYDPEPQPEHVRPLGHGFTNVEAMIEFLKVEHSHSQDSKCTPELDPCVSGRNQKWKRGHCSRDDSDVQKQDAPSFHRIEGENYQQEQMGRW